MADTETHVGKRLDNYIDVDADINSTVRPLALSGSSKRPPSAVGTHG
jgi:hypothetical protein